ncbi:hypothetical protein DM02DRAFT_660891 [Periconia macrospinosa]|uniref:Uncharacterized protein n=1 Tax=Periconia macrospinosa TaxID=97972 RepID=A0A2V1D990_9PLEO|nr:hypothetical protein DM02DRAFT_660891 [Periconia macrospinosa]
MSPPTTKTTPTSTSTPTRHHRIHALFSCLIPTRFGPYPRRRHTPSPPPPPPPSNPNPPPPLQPRIPTTPRHRCGEHTVFCGTCARTHTHTRARGRGVEGNEEEVEVENVVEFRAPPPPPILVGRRPGEPAAGRGGRSMMREDDDMSGTTLAVDTEDAFDDSSLSSPSSYDRLRQYEGNSRTTRRGRSDEEEEWSDGEATLGTGGTSSLLTLSLSLPSWAAANDNEEEEEEEEEEGEDVGRLYCDPESEFSYPHDYDDYDEYEEEEEEDEVPITSLLPPPILSFLHTTERARTNLLSSISSSHHHHHHPSSSSSFHHNHPFSSSSSSLSPHSTTTTTSTTPTQDFEAVLRTNYAAIVSFAMTGDEEAREDARRSGVVPVGWTARNSLDVTRGWVESGVLRRRRRVGWWR